MISDDFPGTPTHNTYKNKFLKGLAAAIGTGLIGLTVYHMMKTSDNTSSGGGSSADDSFNAPVQSGGGDFTGQAFDPATIQQQSTQPPQQLQMPIAQNPQALALQRMRRESEERAQMDTHLKPSAMSLLDLENHQEALELMDFTPKEYREIMDSLVLNGANIKLDKKLIKELFPLSDLKRYDPTVDDIAHAFNTGTATANSIYQKIQEIRTSEYTDKVAFESYFTLPYSHYYNNVQERTTGKNFAILAIFVIQELYKRRIQMLEENQYSPVPFPVSLLKHKTIILNGAMFILAAIAIVGIITVIALGITGGLAPKPPAVPLPKDSGPSQPLKPLPAKTVG